MGVDACIAVCTPILAFVAPGPRVTKHKPTSPVNFAQASAIKEAPPSLRQLVNSKCGLSQKASKIDKKLSPGTPKPRLAPKAINVSTTARPPEICDIFDPINTT